MGMNICYATDDLYSRLVLVSLKSLFLSNMDIKEIHVYIVEDHISAANKRLLMDLAAEYKRNLTFISLSEKHAALYSSIKGQKRVSPVVYSYCFLQDILPQEVDRVLLLEGDELILSNLELLYETDLSGCYFAAADDLQSKWLKKKLGMKADSPYFNAGVILFNFAEMRRDHASEKITEIIQSGKSEFFYEAQDELSVLAEGKVKVLPPKYNSTTATFLFDKYENMLRYRKPSTRYTKEEFIAAREHPVIVHFTKNQIIQPRPWIDGCTHPYKEQYLAIKAQTVLANEKLWARKEQGIIHKVFSWVYFKGMQGFVASLLGLVHAVLFPVFLYRFL